jgi:ABC-type polysaccharide/polyol phosphate export permease
MGEVDMVAGAGPGQGSRSTSTNSNSLETAGASGVRPYLDLHGEWTPPAQLLRSIWASRDLMATLARKDFFVRYRRASLGVLWAVGLPLVQAVVLSFVFSHFRLIRVGAQISIPVYIFTGITVWSFFSGTVTAASTAIVDGAGLSSKIYFPRAVLPLVCVRSNLYSFVVSLGIVLGMALAFGVGLDQHVLLLVPGVALLIWLSAVAGLTLSALHVYFRDVRYVVTAIFTALLYLTPVFLPMAIYQGALRVVVLVNPVTGVVEVFRLAIGGADPQWPTAIASTLGWCVFLTGSALYLHCRRDRVFVDLL